MSLAAGKLRHQVALQKQVVSQDSTTGEMTVTWTDVATLWAAIEPLSAREFVAAQATQSKVTARVTIRQRPDIDATMRLVHMVNGVAGKVYNIAGVLADKESGLEYQTLPVSGGVNDGE